MRRGQRLARRLAQPRQGFRRARPRAERHLVGADMDDLRREQLDQFVEDGFEDAVGLFARRVEAVVGESLHRKIGAVLAGIAQLGDRLQHRVAMAGHVDLRHHLDAEPAGQRDDLADRRLAVVAAGALRPRAEQRRHFQPMAAPGADFRQLRIGVDLDAPGLVVRQMPVEAVELVPGEDFQEARDLGAAVELPRDIEMDAAPAERRLVADLALGREHEGLGMTARAAQDLAERDQPVEQPGAGAA